MLPINRDKYFLNEALKVAKKALPFECPVGCVIIYKNQIISSAHNLTNKNKHSLAHAELICLEELSLTGFNDFENIEIYITSEPCIMCADYLNQLNIKHIIYGEKNFRFGIHLIKSYIKDNNIILKEIHLVGYIDLLKQFYSQINFKAPENIRKTKKKIYHGA